VALCQWAGVVPALACHSSGSATATLMIYDNLITKKRHIIYMTSTYATPRNFSLTQLFIGFTMTSLAIYWLYYDITNYLLAVLYQDEQTFVSILKIKVVY
jgi:hypothetical protein